MQNPKHKKQKDIFQRIVEWIMPPRIKVVQFKSPLSVDACKETLDDLFNSDHTAKYAIAEGGSLRLRLKRRPFQSQPITTKPCLMADFKLLQMKHTSIWKGISLKIVTRSLAL